MSLLDTAKMFVQYKAWADEVTFETLSEFPQGELYKERSSYFKTIIATLSHIYVVDDIFKAHLIGQPHGYITRNTEKIQQFDVLWPRQKVMNQWYIDYVSSLDEKDLARVVNFEYVGGGHGSMSVMEILLHIVNHATNHRGNVNEAMCDTTLDWPAHDLTIYLRDIHVKDGDKR